MANVKQDIGATGTSCADCDSQREDMLSTFVLPEPSEPAKSISSPECLELSTNGLLFNLSKSDDVEVTR